MEQTIEENPFVTQKCPVCNGFGTVKYGTLVCGACSGRGYLILDKRTGLPVEGKGGQK